MSPLWRDQLRVALCPDRIVLARLKRGWRPTVAGKQILNCLPSSEGVAWRPTIELLKSTLTKAEWSAPDATVILSNHFVRYLLLPYDAQLKDEADVAAYARHRFEEIYGDVARRWMVRLTKTGSAAPVVASAIDGELVSATQEIFRAAHINLCSLQPYLMAAYNQFRKKLDKRECWFVTHEAGRLNLCLFRKNAWSAVASRRVGQEWLRELPAMLDREHCLASEAMPCADVLTYATEYPAGEPFALDRYRLERLESFPLDDPLKIDSRFDMALQGLR